MFAPAEWEDVPENTANFPRIRKGKKNSLADKAAVEPVCVSTKVKKNKHKKNKNNLTDNIQTVIVHKDQETSKRAPKRTHSAPEVKLQVEENGINNGPPRKKQKRNKTSQKNLLQLHSLEKPEKLVCVSTKVKKNKHKKNKNAPTENIQKVIVHKDHETSKTAPKRTHSAPEVKLQVEENGNNNGPPTNKQKRNKATLKNLLQLHSLEKLDETLIANKKEEMFNTVKSEEMLFKTINLRTPMKASGASLRQRMTERLRAAQFRYLNEQLYVSEGKDAKELFKNDPTSFKIYHDGFQQQVKKWPINPLNVIVKQIMKMPKDTKIADMGCGEGMLAKRVPQKVRSFDLVSAAEGVEECDMAHTPLLSGEMDVVVYCLALMGTNLKEYLIEANRILKVGGIMKIAEVESRFKDVNDFVKSVECYGFKMTQVDNSHNVFFFLTFQKLRDLGSKRNKLPYITLEPCLYKKR